MSTTTSNQSDKLGSMPISKLILKMSGPAIFSMLVQALYNIVDSIYIGMYDATNGVLALSYALPMQLLVNAFAIGLAVGTGSLISRRLGERNREDASLAAQTGLLLSIFMGVIFLIVGYFVSHEFISVYTKNAASSQEALANWELVAEEGGKYLTICMCCSMGICVEIMLNRILQSMGNMIIPMITQLVGALTNIILDPIFILPWGTNLGATGAAIATVVGQWVALFIPIIVIATRKWEIHIFFNKTFKLKWNIIKQILIVGLPTIILNAIGSLVYMISNILLNTFVNAVWAFGIFFKLQSLIFMPVFGLNQGVMPILGYNYGANNQKRFNETFWKAVFLAMGYMTTGLIVFHALPEYLIKLFSPDTPEKIEAGIHALRLCSTPFILASVDIMIIAMFNAIGHGFKAMLVSLLRQAVVFLPMAYVLSNFTNLGVFGYWLGYPIAEIVTLTIFFPIAMKTIKDIFKEKKLQLEVDQNIEQLEQ